MDLNTVNEMMSAYPASLFIAGVSVGFVLRGLFSTAFSGETKARKHNRYRSRKSEVDIALSQVVLDHKASSADWSERTIKKIVQRGNRYANRPKQHVTTLQSAAD